MSNQHKSTASRSWLAKTVWKLPTALLVALMALLSMTVVPAFADDEAIILVTHTPASMTAVKGTSLTFQLKVENKGANVLQGVTIAKQECDTLTQTGGAIDGTIPVAGSLTYNCTINNVGTSNFQNQFIVNATNAGTPVTDSSIAQITVLDPVVSVTKKATPDTIVLGANAVFEIKVKNTGLTTIDNSGAVKQLVVTDSQCDTLSAPAGDVGGDSKLTADTNVNDGTVNGEEWTYTCTINKPLTDVNNTVLAEATVNGIKYSRSANATVKVLVPGLNITKSVEKPVVSLKSNGVGGFENATVKWTVKVINTGQIALTPPTGPADAVVDTISAGACALAFVGTDTGAANKLDPGETWTYECTSTHNTAGDVTNTATEKFSDDGKVDTQAKATAKFVVPGISITKSPAYDEKLQNSDVSWIIVVKNTGESNLTDVVLKDLICSNAVNGELTPTEKGNGDAILNADIVGTTPNEAEEWKYVCNYTKVQNDLVNVAAVTAKDLSGNKVEGLATAFVKVIKPGITITKKLQNTVTPAKNELYEGQKAVFELTVQNTGNGPLTDIKIDDFGCDAPNTFTIASLAAGATAAPVTCEKKAGTVPDGFENVANVVAKDQFGKEVKDDDKITVNVLIAGLLLEKTPAENIAKEGDTPEWKLIVRNTGDGTLTPQDHVGTTDDLNGIYDPLCAQPANLTQTSNGNGNGVLEPNETWEFLCKANPMLTYTSDEIINTAFAWFKDLNGTDKRDSEKAIVRVVRQSIDLDKTASPAVVVVGKPVTFKFDVRNFSSKNLTGVKVTDVMCPGGAPTQTGNGNGNALLEPGEVWTYTCEVPGSQVTKDFTNIATAEATDPNNQKVTDQDDASVVVINAKMDVTKTAEPSTINQGSSVKFVIAVKNTGTVQLKDVKPVDEDPRCPVLAGPTGDSIPNGLLDPNETWSYTCTIANVQSSFTNKVKVTATEVGANALAVEGSDDATVTVLAPGINLQKIANQSSVAQGGAASFTILISNAGDTNLTTSGPVDPDCATLVVLNKGNNDAILNVGETWVYSCTVTNVQGTNGLYTNKASVQATDANGVPVSAAAEASVTVTTTPPPPPPPSGGLSLAQTVNPTTVTKGGSATFQATLSNGTANTVAISSFKGDKCKNFARLADNPGDNDSSLESGETWVWSCVLSNIKKSTTNKVTVKIASPKQTLTASATVSVLSARGILIELDPNEVIEADPAEESEREVIDEAEEVEAIDESLLVNKIYIPVATK